MLDVTVLVPVGTQLHGWDRAHAGLTASWSWDSHAGAITYSPVGTWPQRQDSHVGAQTQ